ncbi:MAG: hypothetical protein LBC70_00010 [Chitinispirillales bacterium]|jgi:hypothetical protein|nr:hypothetical protein [Chitinispirillales bacterium]
MKIEKSAGVNESENILSELCDRTFLKIWNYANPYKNKPGGKTHAEFCDNVAIFENHIFIFFVRNKKFTPNSKFGLKVEWNRFHKEVIEQQIRACYGAERYIKNGGKLYLRSGEELPIKYDLDEINIHKIIIAHGVEDACLNFSEENIYGSLAISYNKLVDDKFSDKSAPPFCVRLPSENPIHVFDSHNLEIMLKELDTFHDFKNYIVQKEKIISEKVCLIYGGEEDLLAHYLLNNTHFVDMKNDTGLCVAQGWWHEFVKSSKYQAIKEKNKISYFWDELINELCASALKGELLGNANFFTKDNGIYEMASEPRVARRILSEKMVGAIEKFQNDTTKYHVIIALNSPRTNVSLSYVFLQYRMKFEEKPHSEEEIGSACSEILEIACGVTKPLLPKDEKIVGIGMFTVEYHLDTTKQVYTTKSVLLMDCSSWNKEREEYYNEKNKSILCKFGFSVNPSNQSRRQPL